jgi:glycosyltransferase involved in cell wall biosynthesis
MSSLRIARVATVPFFLLHHLGAQIRCLVRAGHRVDLVCSRGSDWGDLASIQGVEIATIEIPRKIAPFSDALALFRLYRLFSRRGYEIVHSTTPKAGLLSALAGRAAGVPIRLHTFTGQPWTEMRGPVRWVARTCDRVIIALNTQCYTDSGSQREFLISEGIGTEASLRVLGAGSLAGVDAARWERARQAYRNSATYAALGLPDGVPVTVFVGRVTRDKGVVELLRAFRHLLSRGSGSYLVVIGPMEAGGDRELLSELAGVEGNERIRLVGYDPEPERTLAIADLLCLPSYREGFGNVVIEAAVMGIPTVGTSIVGLRDSVVDGVTGLLVPPKDWKALAEALARVTGDAALRKRLGEAARARALEHFDAARVNALVLQEYERLHGQLERKHGHGG